MLDVMLGMCRNNSLLVEATSYGSDCVLMEGSDGDRDDIVHAARNNMITAEPIDKTTDRVSAVAYFLDDSMVRFVRFQGCG